MESEVTLTSLLDARQIIYMRQSKAILALLYDKLAPLAEKLGIPFPVTWDTIERYPAVPNPKYVIITGLTKIPEEYLDESVTEEDEQYNMLRIILPVKLLETGTPEQLITALDDIAHLQHSLSYDNFIKFLDTVELEGSLMDEKVQKKLKTFLDNKEFEGFKNLTQNQIKDIILFQKTNTERKH